MTSQNGLLQKSLHCSLYVCLTALDFPILSQVHPFNHFRVILYQEHEEWMGVCRKRARGMIRSPHSPLPSTSCQGFPLAIEHLMCQPLWQKAGWRRVNSGSGGAKIHSTVLNQCLGLLSDESMILYLFFFLCGRSPDTLSSVLVGKIRFSTNLRFGLWPAKWVVLPFTKAWKKHD